MDELPSAELFRRYRDGSSSFANEIYDRYIERLLSLARRHLSKQLQRRFDEEDVVQSAFHSFFRRARGDQFRIVETNELWRLLAGITMNKLRRQVEIHRAAKRTPQQETCDAEITEGWELTPDVGLVDAVCLTEQLELALDDCSLDERMVLLGSLRGKESVRLADELQKSERTIRRWLRDARRKVERRLLSEASDQAKLEVSDVGNCRYDDYQLLRMLGSGGMGRVYLAREKRTGRCFALKAIRKKLQYDPLLVSQFAQEAELLGSLSHPRIVRSRGIGQFPSGGLFLVMDYIDGTNLADALTQRKISTTDVPSLADAIAETLCYLHTQGVVHGDLKPANVLLDGKMPPYLVDFGLATLALKSTQSSSAAILVGGTLGYSAPELVSADSMATPSSDIYAYGKLLHDLVDGTQYGFEEGMALMDGPCRSLTELANACADERPEIRVSSATEIRARLRQIADRTQNA